ncbi:hypothetical protein HNY73_019983 [Argiope bruennichi]|uniref:Uncharacterized protein n=1 Tax=Argiope bruennichi TaxID=94029 RepID=A0A8T0E557_ARGBR|nr:hypothetical protein HNY73_019983 [Argiope bruennichi]
MAKDIFFVSVGCLHLGYTAIKIYQAFNNDFPFFTSNEKNIRNLFQSDKSEIAQFTEPDAQIKAVDVCLNDSDLVSVESIPELSRSNNGKSLKAMIANNCETNKKNYFISEKSPPSLSRRAQAIKTAMTMKSKRWFREQTKKDYDSLIFHSATNYKYAKRLGFDAKLAPQRKGMH